MTTTRARLFTDVRFLIGIALVAASILGVWAVVAVSRQTTTSVAAARTLVPGQVISAEDLRSVDVSLGAAAPSYPTALAPVIGQVLTRTVSEGELIPLESLTEAASIERTSVVVSTDGAVSAAVKPGATVELWQTPIDNGTGKPERPSILVADAYVASVAAGTGALSASATHIELVVPRTSVADVLDAQAKGAALAVIPGGGTP